ncbi:hypothetical protein [Vibrio parahaemolyticus]|uniref:hypothetical protein n=1 Tax=Vibrio parahaemolyticus TaxID=670 RepID=UPI000ACFF366|nr:hypothetical protein [Vibrio parahaemolyticus]
MWGVILPVCSLGIVGWFWFNPTMYIEAWNPHSLPFGEAVSFYCDDAMGIPWS